MTKICKYFSITIFTFCIFIKYADAQIVADFSSNVIEGCSPLTVTFEDKSQGNNLTYNWLFGNGNRSTDKNPSAIYFAPGTYTVSLTVTDPNNVSNTKTEKKYITVFKNPKADFNYDKDKGCKPLRVNFSDNSQKGDGDITNFLWDFGDGNSSTDKNYRHTYRVSGQFSPSLEITDENGCTDKIQKNKIINVFKDPEINFSANKTYSCSLPFTVVFTNLTDSLSNQDIYLWEFGDGSTSNQRHPQHTYTTEGTFDVTLTVINKNGCKATKVIKKYISTETIVPDFKAVKREICQPGIAEFSYTGTPQIAEFTYSWNLGNGQRELGSSVFGNYTLQGKYDIELTVSYGNCVEKIKKEDYITVHPKPKPDVFSDKQFSCEVPFEPTFTRSGSGFNQYYIEVFNYSDEYEKYDNDPIFKHKFDNEGLYHVKMVAQNEFGCIDSIIKENYIEISLPEARFSYSPLFGCAPLKVEFKNISLSKDNIVNNTWEIFKPTANNDYQKIHTENIKELNYTFRDTGVYKVKLTIETASGCTADTFVFLPVGQQFEPYFELEEKKLCNIFNQELINLSPLRLRNDTAIRENVDWFWVVNRTKIGGFWIDTNHYGYTNSWYGLSNNDAYDKSGRVRVDLISNHNGCFDTFTVSDKWEILPPDGYLGTYDTCGYDTTILLNLSKNATSFFWEFPNNKKVYDKDSLIVLPGDTLPFQLVVINENYNCQDTLHIEKDWSKTVNASFIYYGENCAPADYEFINTSYSPNQLRVYYHWVKPDFGVTNSARLNYTFPSTGQYNVSLIAIEPIYRCSDTLTRTINVTGPEVFGEFEQFGKCLPIDLVLNSGVRPDTFSEIYWEIGNQKYPATDKIINLKLNSAVGATTDSTLPMKLIAIDKYGCKAEQDFVIKIETIPKVGLKVTKFRGCNSKRFNFTAELPAGYRQEDYTFYWNMGDGTIDTGNYFMAHTFPRVDSYMISLKIVPLDRNLCPSLYEWPFDVSKENLFADFDILGDKTVDCPPLFVQFINKSTTSSREIKRYLWDFGNGSFSEEKNPKHNYLKAGKFTVTLIIENEWGCLDTALKKDIVLVKGPIGEFDFDNTEGCQPLTVNFTSKTERTHHFEWDFGNGRVVEDTANFTMIYKDTGTYIPVLILSDTFGCTYTLPPIDTIHVFPYPIVDFNITNSCLGDEVSFYDYSSQLNQDIAQKSWDINGQNFSIDTPKLTFDKKGVYPVKLTLVNSGGCENSLTKEVSIHDVKANFVPESGNKCLGMPTTLINTSYGDFPITETHWFIEPDIKDSSWDAQITLKKTGPIEVLLAIKDSLGCRDTIINSSRLIVGDTIKPAPIEIHRTTVLGDFATATDFQTYPQSDFKAYHLLRNVNGSFLNVANSYQIIDTSIQEAGLNTLENVYCYKVSVENACGLISDIQLSEDHCTVEPKAKGGQNHILVEWNPYFGWEQVKAYEIYREKEGEKGNYIYLNTVPSHVNSYIDSNISCAIKRFYRIKAIQEKIPVSYTSWSDTCAATPIWNYQLPPNELVRATVVKDKYVQIDWDSIINPKVPVVYYEIEKSDDGINYKALARFDAAENKSMGDKDTRVDDQSYFYRSVAVDVCGNKSPYSNFGKTILLKADTGYGERPYLKWSTYKGWNEGVSYYEVQRKEEDGSFITLASNINPSDTSYIDYFTQLNERPNFCYRIMGVRNGEDFVTSHSNEDCAPVKSRLFVPNAFSPNGDGINDEFVIKGLYIKEYEIKIYNRWGEQLWESNSLYRSWDGNYKDNISHLGVYAFKIRSVGIDGVIRNFAGTFHLLE